VCDMFTIKILPVTEAIQCNRFNRIDQIPRQQLPVHPGTTCSTTTWTMYYSCYWRRLPHWYYTQPTGQLDIFNKQWHEEANIMKETSYNEQQCLYAVSKKVLMNSALL
jgi:hypothetical protein